MKKLVLDAGPLIALVSQQDHYHSLAKKGFTQITREFGQILTPLPILFEVYKFVCRNQSAKAAQFLLTLLEEETMVIPLTFEDFSLVSELVINTSHWGGTLEDASVIVIAQQNQALIWTIDYKDLGYFQNVSFWNPV